MQESGLVLSQDWYILPVQYMNRRCGIWERRFYGAGFGRVDGGAAEGAVLLSSVVKHSLTSDLERSGCLQIPFSPPPPPAGFEEPRGALLKKHSVSAPESFTDTPALSFSRDSMARRNLRFLLMTRCATSHNLINASTFATMRCCSASGSPDQLTLHNPDSEIKE